MERSHGLSHVAGGNNSSFAGIAKRLSPSVLTSVCAAALPARSGVRSLLSSWFPVCVKEAPCEELRAKSSSPQQAVPRPVEPTPRTLLYTSGNELDRADLRAFIPAEFDLALFS